MQYPMVTWCCVPGGRSGRRRPFGDGKGIAWREGFGVHVSLPRRVFQGAGRALSPEGLGGFVLRIEAGDTDVLKQVLVEREQFASRARAPAPFANHRGEASQGWMRQARQPRGPVRGCRERVNELHWTGCASGDRQRSTPLGRPPVIGLTYWVLPVWHVRVHRSFLGFGSERDQWRARLTPLIGQTAAQSPVRNPSGFCSIGAQPPRSGKRNRPTKPCSGGLLERPSPRAQRRILAGDRHPIGRKLSLSRSPPSGQSDRVS
jgi:hypothetical protein